MYDKRKIALYLLYRSLFSVLSSSLYGIARYSSRASAKTSKGHLVDLPGNCFVCFGIHRLILSAFRLLLLDFSIKKYSLCHRHLVILVITIYLSAKNVIMDHIYPSSLKIAQIYYLVGDSN